MYKNKELIAENYFLQSGKNVGTNDSFHGDKYYSYSTQIAKLDTENNVLLLSSNRMSTVTSRSIACLRNEARLNNYKVLPVPFQFDDCSMPTKKELVKRFEQSLERISEGTQLALANNRLQYLTEFEAYKEYLTYINYVSKNKERFEQIANKLNDIDYIKDLQRQRRKKS